MAVDLQLDVFNDLLTESINFDPNILSIGNTSDLQMRALLPIIDQIRVLCNVDNQPERVLDLLAFQFQVLFYTGTFAITDPTARIAAKRDLIRNSLGFHSTLGTPAVIERIIDTIYGPAQMQEWFEYGGTHDHFRILLDTVIDTDTTTALTSVLNYIKRASQTFEGFFVITKVPSMFYVAPGVFVEEWLTLPFPVQDKVTRFLAKVTIFASGSVVRASQVAILTATASILATARQTTGTTGTTTIAAHAGVTAASRILRGVIAIIRAGHG